MEEQSRKRFVVAVIGEVDSGAETHGFATRLAELFSGADVDLQLRAGDGVFQYFVGAGGINYCYCSTQEQRAVFLKAKERTLPRLRNDGATSSPLWEQPHKDSHDVVGQLRHSHAFVFFPVPARDMGEIAYLLSSALSQNGASPRIAFVGWDRKQLASLFNALRLHSGSRSVGVFSEPESVEEAFRFLTQARVEHDVDQLES